MSTEGRRIGEPENTARKKIGLSIWIALAIAIFWFVGIVALIPFQSHTNGEIRLATFVFGPILLLLFSSISYFEPDFMFELLRDRGVVNRVRTGKLIIGPIVLTGAFVAAISGHLALINSQIGTQKERVSIAKVIEKHKGDFQRDSNFITLDSRELGVRVFVYISEETLNRLSIGDECRIHINQGILGIYYLPIGRSAFDTCRPSSPAPKIH